MRRENRVGKERDSKGRLLDVKEADCIGSCGQWNEWASFYTDCVTDHWGNSKHWGVVIGQGSAGHLDAGLRTLLKECGSLGDEASW